MSQVQNTQPVSIYQKLKNSSSVKYSGSDPGKCDIPEFERRDPGRSATGKGDFVNTQTGKWLRPDLNHAPPTGPHWDYGVLGSAQTFRIFPNNTILPK